MRLRDALEKEVEDTVEALMCNSKNVESIINILAETYGLVSNTPGSMYGTYRRI